ncbi:MAG: 5'-methylthioadenosine/adenosylhomocysteine nucleosidase [Clostridia bacterium]|nr:5'-methylthioadenosine/adenosylhomocysteine nucleosidase [Clostridia bacterium]
MIGILGAMSVEIDEIKSRIEEKKIETAGGFQFVSGRLNGKAVVAAKCGIGKVNAAVCAQTMILTYRPELIINVGVGGSLNPALRYGDMAIADRVVQHDFDTSPIGDPVGLVATVNRVYFDCDPATVACVKAVVDEMDGVNGMVGVVASGDQFVADAAVKARIVERFHAISCEMEGGAISQACLLAGVKCAVIRSISDNADEGSTTDYGQFVKLAAARSTEVLCRVMERLPGDH